MALKASFS